MPDAVALWGAALWFAFLLGYVLLPALRGTASGLSSAIDSLSLADAVLAQALGLFGMLLVVRHELVILRARGTLFVRAITIPTTAVVMTLVMNAAADALNPVALLALGASGALLVLAVGAARYVTEDRRTAWLSAALGMAGAVSALSLAARLIVLLGQPEQTAKAALWVRGLSTLAFVISLTFTALTLFRLGRSTPKGRLVLGAVLTTALVVSLVGARPAGPDAPYVQVLLSRGAMAFARPPLPFLPDATIMFAEVAGFAAALWALQTRAVSKSMRATLALCLLAVRGPDIPLLSLALALGALLAEATVCASKVTTSAKHAAPLH